MYSVPGTQKKSNDPINLDSDSDVITTENLEPAESKEKPTKKKTLGKKPTAVGAGKKGSKANQPSIVAAMGKVKPSKRKMADSDSDVPKQKKKAAPKKTVTKFSDSDSDVDMMPVKVKPKAAPRISPPPRFSDSDSEVMPYETKVMSQSDDDEFLPKPKAKKATKAKPKAKPAQAKPKSKPKPKAKSKWSDSEDDVSDNSFKIDDSFEVAPRSRTGRSKAPVKYNFGDSSDSDF